MYQSARELPGYHEGKSVEEEGRRRKGRSKKRENWENLDAKPFFNPDPTPPSLDDPDPGGNSEKALEQRNRRSSSSPRL
ncbi:hypothetical protein BHE74_00020475 [Ensete ventricosum]|nr:hypothetical protein GW17_00001588 [Ensete ventricosum]RWW71761.1 hypothetical protein BHE74_00020475 [Ensete ventricosum]RZR94194.1 hypothetical protein BHM03_00022848 [Ensete ventricosum]